MREYKPDLSPRVQLAVTWAENSVPELARRLGIDRHSIYQWQENVPEKRALKIELLSKGELRAWQLNGTIKRED